MYGLGGGPGAGSPFGVYRPATVPSDLVPQYVHVAGQNTVQIDSVAPTGDAVTFDEGAQPGAFVPGTDAPAFGTGPTVQAPLGTVVGTRSGDKGGDANLGVYVRTDEAWPWLDETLTVERLRELLPETADLPIDRYRFPKLRSLNFVIRGLLDEGVAASTRQDAQAKALGEWLRSRVVDIPVQLLEP
jgi:hypothetical protein